jgi:hypothetical protein
MVRFCTWCNEVCIRPSVIRAEDSIIVYIYGGEHKAFWNGREVMVGDGICEKCRAERFPETVARAASAENQVRAASAEGQVQKGKTP